MSDAGVEQLFRELEGSWQGSVKTWLKPDEPAVKDAIESEFNPILGLPMLRHSYRSQFQGKHRTGEETIAFNSVSGQFEMT